MALRGPSTDRRTRAALARHGRGREQFGFTLMELMVTMTIAAGLMGTGVALFMNMGKRTAGDNALAGISSLIVNVRNASSRFPASIRVEPTVDTPGVDPKPASVTGMAQEVRQELHFDQRNIEGRAEPFFAWGIEGRECNGLGASIEPQHGRVGGALRLTGGRVDCGKYAAYDVTDGLTVELWMKPDNVSAAELVTKGDALSLRLESNRRISARIAVASDHGQEPVTESCEVPAIRPGVWTGVRVVYDMNLLAIYVNDGFGWVLHGAKPERRPLVTSPDAPLAVGGFSGLLDDFRFAGVHSEIPFVLPPDVKILGDKPYTIAFAGGQLDPAQERGPKFITLQFAGRVTKLEVASNGSMRVSYPDAPPVAADAAGGKEAPAKAPEKE